MSKKQSATKNSDSPSTKQKQSVLFIADIDSQVYGSLPFAYQFKERGWEVIYCVPDTSLLPSNLHNSLLEKFPIISCPLEDIPVSNMIKHLTTIGVFLTGSTMAQFRRNIHTVAKISHSRPILFNGFNGLVYEKIEEGLSWRLGYDIICLNSPNDKILSDSFLNNSPYAEQKIVVTGINRKRYDEAPSNKKSSRKKLIFAEQTIVPRSVDERLYLLQILNQLALANPDWDIIIKLRTRVGEKTFHKEVLSFESYLENSAENLIISHTALNELLDDATMLCTISSTAIFDALSRNIPVFVIKDFGIRTNFGTHLFLSSNLSISIADRPKLDEIVKLKPAKIWLKKMGMGDEYSIDALIDLIESGEIKTNHFPANPYDNRFFPTPKLIKENREEITKKITKKKPESVSPERKTNGFFNIFKRKR